MLLLAATITLLSLTTISVTAQKQALPDWLNGVWEGRGYQIPNLEWDMRLYKSASDATAIISYPGLDCSGNWQLMRQAPDKIVLCEVITQNSGRCASPMWVYLTRLNADVVLAEFAFDWEPQKISAKGILRRRPQA